MLGPVAKSLKTNEWYSAREASALLKEVTEATVKEYCKLGKLTAKKVGPRKRWMVSGASIRKLRKEWELE